jgi:antitoxin MazE
MKLTVRKWGNSASVRIPAALMEAANLSLDQTIDMREENGRLVIEPIADAPIDLNVLLARITDENLHDATEFGPPTGKEVW